MKFQRLQDKLTRGQYIRRNHYNVPSEVYDYASEKVKELKKISRKNCPTIADILYLLVIEALEDVPANHIFRNVKRDDSTYSVGIKVGNGVDKNLKDLQYAVSAGFYALECELNKKGKPITEINLTSLAVNLMEIAIKNEQNGMDKMQGSAAAV